MATLYKHGAQLATLDRLTCRLAYMADGKILRNQGDGWKLYRSVKPGVDPSDHAKSAQANYGKLLEDRPALAAYRAALHAATTLNQRYLVNECLNMLANDPDGVWSELTDMAGIHLDIDEVVQLCNLHTASADEALRLRQAKPQSV